MDNFIKISGVVHTITKHLSPYVCDNIREHFGVNWWELGVINCSSNLAIKELPQSGDYQELVHSLDALNALKLIDFHWRKIFKFKMDKICGIWVRELIIFRNEWAHIGSKDYSESNTNRFIDTATKLFESLCLFDGIEDINQLLIRTQNNIERFNSEWETLKSLLYLAEEKRLQLYRHIRLFEQLLSVLTTEPKTFCNPLKVLNFPTSSQEILESSQLSIEEIVINKFHPLVLILKKYNDILDNAKIQVDNFRHQLEQLIQREGTTFQKYDTSTRNLLMAYINNMLAISTYLETFPVINGSIEISEKWRDYQKVTSK